MTEKLVKVSGRSILVPPGIALKPVVTASIPVAVGDHIAKSEADLAHAEFRLEYSETSGRYEIASFGIDRRSMPVEITGALWRTIRVHSIVRGAIEIALPLWTWPITELQNSRAHGGSMKAPAYTASDPDGLLLAAVAYRIAEISSENPALAVAQTLHLKQRTATNWVQRARAAGYMTSADHQTAAHRIADEIRAMNPHETITITELAYKLGWDGKSEGERDGDS